MSKSQQLSLFSLPSSKELQSRLFEKMREIGRKTRALDNIEKFDVGLLSQFLPGRFLWVVRDRNTDLVCQCQLADPEDLKYWRWMLEFSQNDPACKCYLGDTDEGKLVELANADVALAIFDGGMNTWAKEEQCKAA